MTVTNRPRREGLYVTRHARAVTARIMAVIDDPLSAAPTGPMPFMTLRVGGVFDRIMAACAKTPAPAEVVDVRSSSVLPPPRKPRKR